MLFYFAVKPDKFIFCSNFMQTPTWPWTNRWKRGNGKKLQSNHQEHKLWRPRLLLLRSHQQRRDGWEQCQLNITGFYSSLTTCSWSLYHSHSYWRFCSHRHNLDHLQNLSLQVVFAQLSRMLTFTLSIRKPSASAHLNLCSSTSPAYKDTARESLLHSSGSLCRLLGRPDHGDHER